MAVAEESRKRWWVPALLFAGAFVGAVIFAAAQKRSTDEPRDAMMRTAEALSRTATHVIAPMTGAASVSPRASAALQKPGPPDPDAERSAAESAERAANAAAALAASAGGSIN